VLAAHAFLWALIAVTLFPLLAGAQHLAAARQLRHRLADPQRDQLEHWKLALGMPHGCADGTLVQPPFPVLLWLWNSHQGGHRLGGC
jgi:maltose/maltodextrin transport system permease protein